MKTAIFPGSFDPFTIGHAAIVERGLSLFDRIVIGVGKNESKRSLYSAEERVKAISQMLQTHISDIEITSVEIGAVIGTYIGPGGIALAYEEKKARW